MPDREFHAWLVARGFDPDALHPSEEKFLRSAYEYQRDHGPKAKAAVAKPAVEQLEIRG